ncbi:MAG: CRISPR-associated endonuclease Cas3'' [Acidobacteriaceae bacterium]|nr:CRISPR-associated endonuclease Cas3'' [Acidobacteriaceae bacterium]
MTSDTVPQHGPYAHTLPQTPPEYWEPLAKHLEEVAAWCAKYASAFRAEEWGWIAGRCHDLGKGSTEFQKKLHASIDAGEDEDASPGKRVDHSTYGARYVNEYDALRGYVGRILAFCIAGHHAGLPNDSPEEDSDQKNLLFRLERKQIPDVDDPQLNLTAPALPFQSRHREELAFSLAFFTRMLLSCLVDADRTCTEAFCDRDAARERALPRPSLQQLRERLDIYLNEIQRKVSPTDVNAQRRFVLDQCMQAAYGRPGFYSLQVPTGGGKTLSSLAFALHHATKQTSRVVMAIPFTSIIEQTADVYRKALGDYAKRGLVEHHTNVQPAKDTRSNKLAAENWDAPLIVTTNVQLFESLFAASTTPCRKLHNLANSIIILDEAQTLPVDLLQPTLRALQELVTNYGCTVVLCTATQPALEYRDDFRIGIKDVQPIIKEPEPLFKAMSRVRVEHVGSLKDDELAARLASEQQVLCIVNTRKHAAKLFELVAQQAEKGTVFHLSTMMCGAHRREVLQCIRERLTAGLPCRVVSTQLIEAGVDIDLPVVYRAAAGFDSIAQAAGRCNREGRVPRGTTFVFDAEDPPPQGIQRQGADKAKELWGLDRNLDPLAPDSVKRYFELLYWQKSNDWDKNGIMQKMALDGDPRRNDPLLFQFREIESKYKLIIDNQVPILIPYNKIAEKLQGDLEKGFVKFKSHRELQPYLISVPEHTIRKLKDVVEPHESGVWLLLRRDAYTAQKGLAPDAIGLDTAHWWV